MFFNNSNKGGIRMSNQAACKIYQFPTSRNVNNFYQQHNDNIIVSLFSKGSIINLNQCDCIIKEKNGSLVKMADGWYEVDRTNKVISPRYFSMKEKVLNRRPVKINKEDNWFYVNGKHKTISNKDFESASSFSEDGTAGVTSTNGEAYFINLDIHPISNKRYVSVVNFKKGIGTVNNLSKPGKPPCHSYVKLNKKRKDVGLFPGRNFNSLEMFNNKGFAYVCENGKYFTINTKGERVVTPEEAEFKLLVEKEEKEYHSHYCDKQTTTFELLKASMFVSWLIIFLSTFAKKTPA
jgi:hypothetical protein